MRVRTALLGIGCSLAILIAGCSSPSIPGAPEPPGGGSDSSAVATGGAGSGDTGSGDTGSGTGDSGGGDGTGIPGLSGLPTDLSDLTNIPGISGQCLAVLNVFLAVSTLFLGPTLGGAALTQDQVDNAFKGMDQAPAELQPAIKVLHDAASQAVGKPLAQALTIVAADPVTNALKALSDYTDAQCGQ